jgi:hypothetical protein
MRTALIGLAAVCLFGCPKPAVAPPPPSPQQQLDRLDARAPVPLLPMMARHQKENMRAHLGAVEQIVGGVAANDFAAVEQGAATLGLSPEMEQMCHHMGIGAPGFTDRALAFHKSAEAIAEAARAKDQAKVLAALDVTLKGCTGCHETYKQKVVDDAEWQKVAAAQ